MRGMRTSASLVFDLDVTLRSAFDKWALGLESSKLCKHKAQFQRRDTFQMCRAAHGGDMILDDQWTSGKGVVFTLFCVAPLVSV